MAAADRDCNPGFLCETFATTSEAEDHLCPLSETAFEATLGDDAKNGDRAAQESRQERFMPMRQWEKVQELLHECRSVGRPPWEISASAPRHVDANKSSISASVRSSAEPASGLNSPTARLRFKFLIHQSEPPLSGQRRLFAMFPTSLPCVKGVRRFFHGRAAMASHRLERVKSFFAVDFHQQRSRKK